MDLGRCLALAAAAAMALAPVAGAKPSPSAAAAATLKMKRAVGEFFADTGTKVKAISPAKDKKSGIRFPIAAASLTRRRQGSLKHDGGSRSRAMGARPR